MNREDFPILKNNLIYFDNGATTLKPQVMIDATVDYYRNYSANAHRGDYSISVKVDELYEKTRTLIKVTMDDAIKADETFSILMGDEVEPRREFIENNANKVTNLDV